MIFKKIVGILIILLNLGGIGFLIYLAGMNVKQKIFRKSAEAEPGVDKADPKVEKSVPPAIKNDNIIPDEEDLLKDMDLSDLDNLDLDDFD